jgi:hypothetical protein
MGKAESMVIHLMKVGTKKQPVTNHAQIVTKNTVKAYPVCVVASCDVWQLACLAAEVIKPDIDGVTVHHVTLIFNGKVIFGGCKCKNPKWVPSGPPDKKMSTIMAMANVQSNQIWVVVADILHVCTPESA